VALRVSRDRPVGLIDLGSNNITDAGEDHDVMMMMIRSAHGQCNVANPASGG
jgi:hypothetical protein